MDSTKRIYNFDEFFLSIFQVSIIKCQSFPSQVQLRIKLTIVCALTFFIQLLSFLVTIYKYYFDDLNLKLNELSECLASFFAVLMVFYMEYTYFVRRQKIRKLLVNLEDIFPKTYKDQQAYHLDTYARDIIKKNYIIRKLISVAAALIALIPLFNSMYFWLILNEDYQFLYPLSAWNPFGDSGFFGYAMIYSLQAWTILTGTYCWLKEDILIPTCVAHLCMHYRYLGELLKKLDARKNEENYPDLGMFIRYQYYLDGICNDINAIYSFSNFVVFSFTRILGCMFLYSLVSSNDFMKTPVFTADICALIVSVFLRCSIGMKLFDASSNLVHSIYDSNWYEGSPKYRKMMLIMMIKASRPQSLQAYKMKTISMEYFKEIVVSTYEIFMFIYNLTK